MQIAILISVWLVFASVLVGGFYLRHIINREIAAKDATIENLRAEIEFHKARVAPTLVLENKTLIASVEESQAAKLAIEEQLTEMTKRLAIEGEHKDRTRSMDFLDGMAAGSEGAAQFLRAVARVVRNADAPKNQKVLEGLDFSSEMITTVFHLRIESEKKAIEMRG